MEQREIECCTPNGQIKRYKDCIGCDKKPLELNQNKMKRITKSVIKLSDIPQHLQRNKVLQGHKVHTYAEFHIDDSEEDEFTLWLLSQFPTIKRKTSFLIHIDNI